MDDVKLALLGDRAAQERITARGELLPCWRCGGEVEIQEVRTGVKPLYEVVCKKHYCGAYGCAHPTKRYALAYWNTRAPILSAEELEVLKRERKSKG